MDEKNVTKVANKYHGAVAGSVYIGRGSVWGNPYSHMTGTTAIFKVDSREEAVDAYAQWLSGRADLLARIDDLRGQVLMCYCRPVKGFQGRLMCHGQILAGLADAIS